MFVKDSNQLCVKVGLLGSWPALFYHHSGLYDSISLEGLFSRTWEDIGYRSSERKKIITIESQLPFRFARPYVRCQDMTQLL